jgi:hypothetical protein
MPHIAFCSASFLDLYSRRVIGWAVSNRMKRNLTIRALDMALGHCPRTNGEQGLASAASTEGMHPPHGSWVAILLTRLPESADKARLQSLYER